MVNGEEIGYPTGGTALIKPPMREPTQPELIANPQIAEGFIGEEEFVGPRDVTNAPSTFGPQFDPREQAMADFQPSPETIEFLNNATPEEADRFAYEFAKELSKPRIEDAQDEETFKKIWMRDNGNPYEINPSKHGMATHKEAERDDWTEVFQDTKPFKGFMTEKENKDWLNFREQKLVQRKNDAIRERQNQIEALNFGMDQFRKKKAEERVLRKEQLEQQKEARRLGREARLAEAQEARLGAQAESEIDTARLNYLERVTQNYIKNFGTPRDFEGRMMNLDPRNTLQRFKGWIKARSIEEKKNRLGADDIDSIEQRLMTDLRIPEVVQNHIAIARQMGATVETILKYIERMMQVGTEEAK